MEKILWACIGNAIGWSGLAAARSICCLVWVFLKPKKPILGPMFWCVQSKGRPPGLAIPNAVRPMAQACCQSAGRRRLRSCGAACTLPDRRMNGHWLISRSIFLARAGEDGFTTAAKTDTAVSSHPGTSQVGTENPPCRESSRGTSALVNVAVVWIRACAAAHHSPSWGAQRCAFNLHPCMQQLHMQSHTWNELLGVLHVMHWKSSSCQCYQESLESCCSPHLCKASLVQPSPYKPRWEPVNALILTSQPPKFLPLQRDPRVQRPRRSRDAAEPPR